MKKGLDTCLDCKDRFLGCHGKDEEGRWRCERWGKEKERLAEEREAQRPAYERADLMTSYAQDSRKRWEIKKRSGHLKTR